MKLKIILRPILFRVTAVALGFLVAASLGEVAIRLTMPSRLSRSDQEHTSFVDSIDNWDRAAREHYGLSQIQGYVRIRSSIGRSAFLSSAL
jgi:hypothetical protein